MTTTEPAALRRLRFAWTAAVVAGAISPAVGQVQINAMTIDLQENASGQAFVAANGAVGGSKFGQFSQGVGPSQATIWSGGNEETLNHPTEGFGRVTAAGPGYFGGYTATNQTSAAFALLWVGPNRDRVNLNPTGAIHAVVAAAHGNQQVGSVGLSNDSLPITILSRTLEEPTRPSLVSVQALPMQKGGNTLQAALWHGTAQSFENLHPPGAATSNANDTDGITQVGSTNDGIYQRAARWRGTAGSWVNLGPPESIGSMALGVDGPDIVGYTRQFALPRPFALRPAIWKDDSTTPVLLPIPDGYFSGIAFDVLDGLIVGQLGTHTGKFEAFLWLDRGDVFVNLHEFLDENVYFSSSAQAISFENGSYVISGFARTPYTSDVPVVWTITIPEPAMLYVLAGIAIGRRRRRAL